MTESAFTADASRDLGGPEWLVRRRAAAFETLANTTWPTSAEEIWRYSRVDEFDLSGYAPFSAAELGEPGAERAPGGGPVAAEAGEHGALVVVRNGRVVHCEMDDKLQVLGVTVCDLATCEPNGVAELGSIADASPDAFTVLNDAFLAGGVLVRVPRGAVVDAPIVIVHWSDGDGRASFPRTLVVAGENSECSVVERFGSTGAHLVDAVVELQLHDAARLKYLAVQDHGPKTWSVTLQRAHVGRDASLRSSTIALGGDYARLRTETRLVDQGADTNAIAVYFGDGSQMLDFRTLQDHAAPHTTSDLLFKGAVEDTASSVYSGMVHIRPQAQRTVANQTNRNLVLTEGARAESIPNLIIEANDVKCSHGSTVGPIDDDQRYYLESRGIPPEEAERLIVLGFFEDVFERLPVPSLVDRLRHAVAEKVGELGTHAGGAKR